MERAGLEWLWEYALVGSTSFKSESWNKIPF